MNMRTLRRYVAIPVLLTALTIWWVPLNLYGQSTSIFDRSLSLSNPIPTSTNVVYTLKQTLSTPSVVGSLLFEICSNDPFVGTACVVPSGLDMSLATLDSQNGETGFTIHGTSTANRIILTRAPVANTPGLPSEYVFSDITNADMAGSYYVRLASYTSDDGTGAQIDEGGIAFSLQGGLGVITEVPPYLLFCSGLSIVGTDCSTATGSTVNLGIFSENLPNVTTSEMVAATNAQDGFNIQLIGHTISSGINSIPALAVPTLSIPGTSQFGINLRANNNPVLGANPSGAGIAQPSPDYNIQNQFKFVENDIVASTSTTSNYRKFTVSYLINVSPNQAPGNYATTISFIVFATF